MVPLLKLNNGKKGTLIIKGSLRNLESAAILGSFFRCFRSPSATFCVCDRIDSRLGAQTFDLAARKAELVKTREKTAGRGSEYPQL